MRPCNLIIMLVLMLNPLVTAVGQIGCCSQIANISMIQEENIKASHASDQMHEMDHSDCVSTAESHGCCDAQPTTHHTVQCKDCADCGAKVVTSGALIMKVSVMIPLIACAPCDGVQLTPYPEPVFSTVIPPIA